jgi:hypothetical protein
MTVHDDGFSSVVESLSVVIYDVDKPAWARRTAPVLARAWLWRQDVVGVQKSGGFRFRQSLPAQRSESAERTRSVSWHRFPVDKRASMPLRLNPLDEKRYAQITETRVVFTDVLFFYLANYFPELSRSAEHYPTRRKMCIWPDAVGQNARPILMKRIDSVTTPISGAAPGRPSIAFSRFAKSVV